MEKQQLKQYAKAVADLATDAVRRLRLIQRGVVDGYVPGPHGIRLDCRPEVGERGVRVWFKPHGTLCCAIVASDETAAIERWKYEGKTNGKRHSTMCREIAHNILNGLTCPELRFEALRQPDPEQYLRHYVSLIKIIQ